MQKNTVIFCNSFIIDKVFVLILRSTFLKIKMSLLAFKNLIPIAIKLLFILKLQFFFLFFT